MTVTYHEKFPYLHYSEDLLIASCACAAPHQPQKQSAAQIAPKLDETSSFLLGVVASSMLTNAYRVCFVVRFVGGSLASFHFNNTEPIIKHHLVIHELKYCQRGYPKAPASLPACGKPKVNLQSQQIWHTQSLGGL